MNNKSDFTASFLLGENKQPFTVAFKSSATPYSLPGARYILRTAQVKLQAINNVPSPAVLVRITRDGKTIWEKDSWRRLDMVE